MATCPSCGTTVLPSDAFCPSCGSPLDQRKEFAGEYQEPKGETDFPKQPYPTKMVEHRTAEPLVARNYLYWFLISLVFSPMMFIYYYFNFEDLNKLAKYDRPPGVPSPEVDTNRLIILVVVSVCCGLGIFIFPYIFYLKFEKLYRYIENHPVKLQNKPVSGRKFITAYLISFGIMLLGVIFIVVVQVVGVYSGSMTLNLLVIPAYIIMVIPSLIIGIFNIIWSHRWQEAYNELAYKICPDTIQKDLF